jgi:hypothetical protein
MEPVGSGVTDRDNTLKNIELLGVNLTAILKTV